MDDYYTEGWAALRQCAIDGQHILDCAADITVPQAIGGPEEQAKAELKQYVLSLLSFFLLLLRLPFFSSPARSRKADCCRTQRIVGYAREEKKPSIEGEAS